MRSIVVTVAVLAGCVASGSTRCEDGTICPEATRCVPARDATWTCASDEQLQVCAGMIDGTSCSFGPDVTQGSCHAGACLPSDLTCGNAIVDGVSGEQCDDGNPYSHDGCSSGCTLELPAWRELPLGVPDAREGHAMAFDLARGTTLLFGGRSFAEGPLDDTWEWNGQGWARRAAAFAPHPRAGHAMAYDARRGRVVVFGGAGALPDAQPFSDTWEWDGTRWHLIVPPVSPPARAHHGLAYDPGRGKVVLFGGEAPVTGSPSLIVRFDDVWTWDGATWTQLGPAELGELSPPPTSHHAMAYDPARGEIVVIGGGTSEAPVIGDTWTLGALGWQPHGPKVLPPRRDAAAAFDGLGVVVSGGTGELGMLADLWRWNGSDWQAVPQALPGGRARHAMAFDPRRDRVTIVATDNPAGAAETLEFDRVEVVPVIDDGKALGARGGAAAHSLAKRRAWVFGGCTNTDCSNSAREVLTFVEGVWNRRRVSTQLEIPQIRRDTAMAYHEEQGAAVLFGGTAVDPDGAVTLGDTWLLRENELVTSWELGPTAGPPPRQEHAMVYDVAGGRVLVFGGAAGDGGAERNDLWAWDGAAWVQLAEHDPAREPSPRRGHALGYDRLRGKVVLFGGSSGSSVLADLWELDGSTWTRVTATGPTPRARASFTWSQARGRLVLVGGDDGLAFFDDAWEWDGAAWLRLETALPLPRSGHAAMPASDGTGIVIFGGRTRIDISRDDPLTDTWLLRWESATAEDVCRDASDVDLDGLVGCADPDCWGVCAPLCEPSVAVCDGTALGCGDGTCDPTLESCVLCPEDCECEVVCGDFTCAADEVATCPGDCAP